MTATRGGVVAVAIRSDVVRVWTFRCWRSKSPTFLRCFYGAPRGVARHACCEVGMKSKKAIARVGLDSTLASLLVWATVADAQTPAEGRAKTAILDPIVVTASRTPQSITQLLADVTVIERDAIARAGVDSLAELLQRQPGVTAGLDPLGLKSPMCRPCSRSWRKVSGHFGVKYAGLRPLCRHQRLNGSRSSAALRPASMDQMRSAA